MNSDYVPQQDDEFILPRSDVGVDAPLSKIFKDGRGVCTVMFSVAFFMSLFTVYGLSSWLTKLIASTGYSLGSSLTFVLVLNLGAMIGAVCCGWSADRFNIKFVLVGMNVLAAVSIALPGYNTSTGLLCLLVGVAGGSTIGTQIMIYAFAGQFYPASIRAPGIGWATGVGRSGAICQIVIGVLIGMALPLPHNFIAMAIPAVVATIAVAFINQRRSGSVKA
jgi:MFS transporter, AAHS family, benzoate transport protein